MALSDQSDSGRPRLLDLFCGAGGCSMGYFQAGFDVVGVDLEPQPHYPFPFIQADVMTIGYAGFDAIHASPPCQSYSKAFRGLAHPKPMLIDAIRERLQRVGMPWVIENVIGAPIPHSPTLLGEYGVLICGSSLGLRVQRHRLFETSFHVPTPGGCDHRIPAMNPHAVEGRARIYREYGRGRNPERIWREAMGVGWMNGPEGREAIPPAYTEHIGRYLMAALRLEAAA